MPKKGPWGYTRLTTIGPFVEAEPLETEGGRDLRGITEVMYNNAPEWMMTSEGVADYIMSNPKGLELVYDSTASTDPMKEHSALYCAHSEMMEPEFQGITVGENDEVSTGTCEGEDIWRAGVIHTHPSSLDYSGELHLSTPSFGDIAANGMPWEGGRTLTSAFGGVVSVGEEQDKATFYSFFDDSLRYYSNIAASDDFSEDQRRESYLRVIEEMTETRDINI